MTSSVCTTHEIPIADWSQRPRLTITTVLYNSSDSLDDYAAAVRPAVDSGSVRLIAVDNASPDASAAKLKALIPKCEIINSPTNVGFGGGCNQAWPLVTSDYWMLLNPDVSIDAEALITLVNWMDDHPRVAIASPHLASRDGHAHRVACPPDSIWRVLVEATRLHKLLTRRLRAALLFPGRTSTPSEFKGWVPGTAMLVRANAASQVGLLDPAIFMYGEDVEWCARMVQAGWLIGYCADVTAIHDGGTSASTGWNVVQHVSQQVYGHMRGYAKSHGLLGTRAFAAANALLYISVTPDPRLHDRREVKLRARCYAVAALIGPEWMQKATTRRRRVF